MTKTSNRDNFTEKTKRTLAERVAYRCSFPGCNSNTVGPHKSDHNNRIVTGVASHIYAASPNGPRYSKEMSTDERRSIKNGIWLCENHAKLIDADVGHFSAETINSWKIKAEEKAFNALQLQNSVFSHSKNTLIQLGFNNIFEGSWVKIIDNLWSFKICNEIIGSTIDLATKNISLNENEKFIIVETQGDARIIDGNINYLLHQDACGDYAEIEIRVEDRFPAIDPNKLGKDLKIVNGDLAIENGDFALVGGIERVSQQISLALGTKLGELFFDTNLGSNVSKYYNNYKNDILFLSRMIKMEIIRLSLIPYCTSNPDERNPSLSFINRVHEVRVKEIYLNKKLLIEIDLELADENHTTHCYPISLFV